MSLTNRTRSILIGTGSMLSAGTLTKVEEIYSPSQEGWEGLKLIYLYRVASLTAEQVAALFPQGEQLASRTWWVSTAQSFVVAPGLFRIEVDCKGWAVTRPPVIRVAASANQQSAENILAPTEPGDTVGAAYAKVATHENMPDMTVGYLVANIETGGSTELVGTAQTPPVTIAVPDTVWSFLTKFVYHWPNGWVLMNNAQDRLPGSAAAWVVDSYKFIRDKTPG